MLGISVVLCCYNSALRLPETLKHLQAQLLPDALAWELILVNNNSKDNTVAVAKMCWADSKIPLHVVFEPTAGLAHARKAGFRAANYDYICVVDDDNWLATNYLQNVFAIFQNHAHIGACGGWGEAVFEPEAKVPSWYEQFSNGYAVGKMGQADKILLAEKEFLYGAGMAVRKTIWQELELVGFESMLLGRTADKITSGEDVELGYVIRLLGYDLYFSTSLYFQHLMANNRLTWSYLLKLKKGFGSSAVYHGFYKNVLYPRTLRSFIRRFWFTEFALHLALTCLKTVLFAPHLWAAKEGSKGYASWSHSIGRTAELWNLRTTYAKKQEKIVKLAQQLALLH
jgi:glycosyltransferase involved in cell wall biosynthesis